MTGNKDELFKITKSEHHNGAISAKLLINKECEIFNGHFPGQPVIPGACMLQIVKEVLESTLATSLRLKKADHLKFIVMIDPAITQTVQLNLSCKPSDENALLVTGKIISGEVVCFKFQGTFTSG